MNDVIQAAAELQTICQSQDWQFCFIGGAALQRWGEPRRTVAVDLSLFVGFGDEQKFCDVLLKHLPLEFPMPPRLPATAASYYFARKKASASMSHSPPCRTKHW